MNVVNVMNFVRQIDERFENSTQKMLDLTTKQLHMVNEYGLPNTFCCNTMPFAIRISLTSLKRKQRSIQNWGYGMKL